MADTKKKVDATEAAAAEVTETVKEAASEATATPQVEPQAAAQAAPQVDPAAGAAQTPYSQYDPAPNYQYSQNYSQQQQQQQQQYYAQPQQQYVPQNTKQREAGFGSAEKERWVAAALAFFLGSLGIHKFYLGYKSEAVIMLVVSIVGAVCTLGLGTAVMSIIGIIEAVCYIAQSDEDFKRTHLVEYKGWF